MSEQTEPITAAAPPDPGPTVSVPKPKHDHTKVCMFIDTFEFMSKLCSIDKVRKVKKINKNYLC